MEIHYAWRKREVRSVCRRAKWDPERPSQYTGAHRFSRRASDGLFLTAAKRRALRQAGERSLDKIKELCAREGTFFSSYFNEKLGIRFTNQIHRTSAASTTGSSLLMGMASED